MKWFEERAELAAVARMLTAANWLTSPEDVVYFLEKPWKWENERDAWIGAGRPMAEDAGWQLFAARLERSN